MPQVMESVELHKAIKVGLDQVKNGEIITEEEMNEKLIRYMGKSPFEDIPYITADITTQEIVGLIRESRAGI